MTEEISNFNVSDRKSFIRLLELLRTDLLQNRDDWENKTLEDFLDAMIRYTEDIQGYYDNLAIDIDADNATWRTFEDILRGSTIYE